MTEHYVETEKDFKEIIKKTISQKEKRYLDTGARNILSDPLISDFYKSLYNINSERIKIHLSYLKLDEEILATHLGLFLTRDFIIFFQLLMMVSM